jgi:hypothetical protein
MFPANSRSTAIVACYLCEIGRLLILSPLSYKEYVSHELSPNLFGQQKLLATNSAALREL